MFPLYRCYNKSTLPLCLPLPFVLVHLSASVEVIDCKDLSLNCPVMFWYGRLNPILSLAYILMYKTLHGQIPRYLSGDCQFISDASCRLHGRPTRLHLPCHGPTLVWVTDHLLLPDHRYGTVCRQICT